MKHDRTFLLRHADAAGIAAIDRASRAAGTSTSVIDQPTQEMPRIVDFGAGRGGAAAVRVSVRVVERAEHTAAQHHAARLRG